MSQDTDRELPAVTVIVLNYNGQEHLEPCFRSLPSWTIRRIAWS